MRISPAQCRAARGLLDWKQETLARKAGVGLKTVQDFENGKRMPRNAMHIAIQQALEQAGIEFLDNDGLQYKKG